MPGEGRGLSFKPVSQAASDQEIGDEPNHLIYG